MQPLLRLRAPFLKSSFSGVSCRKMLKRFGKANFTRPRGLAGPESWRRHQREMLLVDLLPIDGVGVDHGPIAGLSGFFFTTEIPFFSRKSGSRLILGRIFSTASPFGINQYGFTTTELITPVKTGVALYWLPTTTGIRSETFPLETASSSKPAVFTMM